MAYLCEKGPPRQTNLMYLYLGTIRQRRMLVIIDMTGP